MKKKILLFFIIPFLISFQKISLSQDLTPEQIYEKVNDCIVVILSYDFDGKLSKQGSGVVINDKGWVVTNYHVFADCEKMEVKHKEKIVKYLDIIGMDVDKDILILKIEDYSFPSISIGNSDNLKVGQKIYAIGSPMGLENSLSEGIISGLRDYDFKNRNYIQITASISHGSSGGAIINSKGELIGISTMTLKEGQNLNFAIPINDILSISLGSYSDKTTQANNNFLRGYNAVTSGNDKEAILYITNFLKVFPKSEAAYINRGLAYGHLKNYTNAISDYNMAIEINPYSAFPYNNRGIIYTDMENYSKAILDYNRAIEIDSNYAHAYNNRGSCYNHMEKYSEAILDYNKAIEIDPNYAAPYFNRGNCNYSLRNKSSACKDWRKAFLLGYTPAEDVLNKLCK